MPSLSSMFLRNSSQAIGGIFLALLFGGMTSCGPRREQDNSARLQASITINKERGLRTKDLVIFQKILVDAAERGEAEIAMEKILPMLGLSEEALEIVSRNWSRPGRIICKGWACQLDVSGQSMTMAASKSIWVPGFGYPVVTLADRLQMKFRHMTDDKTIEFCSISGISVSGFSVVGANMFVDGEQSSFSPVVPPSWSYPSHACDF